MTTEPGPLVASLPNLTAAGAGAAPGAAEAEAARRGWRVCVAVVDAAGHPLAFRRMDGAPPVGIAMAQAKARTAALTRVPTKVFQDLADGGHPSVASAEGVTPIEGGVPIVVDGAVVGAVGASGAQGHEDAQVARAGVERLVGSA